MPLEASMTAEEYALLSSIAAADGTAGPNFDPALLIELLDVFDKLAFVRRELETLAQLAENSTTGNILPRIARIARAILHEITR